jgi:hypothetical protein
MLHLQVANGNFGGVKIRISFRYIAIGLVLSIETLKIIGGE